MNYLCGVTLSSTSKGDIKQVGFYDISNDIGYDVFVSKGKSVFYKKYSLELKANKIKLENFKENYRFVTPISDQLWNKVKKINHVNSINYKELLKHFDLTEWLL
jgi:hypothetical protein